MSSKREEERNEKIIRGLMKLPPNRRCINCNSLGPQYVCTNFWTFVCIACSGIHREFTHRVKSVSMSKFTSQEVDALQSGGNQRARELYLQAWDPQKSRLPDNSNADKVRDFIKKVYVDKLYFQERSTDRPPRDPQSLKNHEDHSRKASSYHSYSQSPPYDFQYEERRYGKQGPTLTRKPGSDRGLYEGKLASFLSPTRSDQSNDDGFANEVSHPRFSDYSVSGGGDPFRPDGLSPSSQRDTGSPFSDTSRDISNEVPQLHKTLQSADVNNTSNGGKILHPQIAHGNGSFGSFDSGSTTIKSVNSPDLPEVDFFSSSFAPQNGTSLPHSNTTTQLPDSSLPPSLNVVQDNFDLFGATFTPQNVTSIPLPGTNAMVHQPSPLNSFPGFSQPQSDASSNGGWATFDMIPQNVAMSMGTEKHAPAVVPSSDGNVIGSFNPFSVGEGSYVASSGHEPSALSKHSFGHESLQTVEASVNHTHSWNAFDNSAGVQPMQSVIKSENQIFVNHASDTDKSIGALNYDGNVRTTNESEPPSSSLLPQSSTAVAGVHLFASDPKPTNPFDLPYESDMESSNMFWNMSSLQAALPNTQAPPSYTVNQTWAFQNSVPSYAPAEVPFDPTTGSLEFMVRQAPNNQASSIHAQGPVASIGGNPFA